MSPAQLSFETLLPFFHICLSHPEIWGVIEIMDAWKSKRLFCRDKSFKTPAGYPAWSVIPLFPPGTALNTLSSSLLLKLFPSRDIFLRKSLEASGWQGETKSLSFLQIVLWVLIFFSALVQILSCRQSFSLCFILLHFWLSWSTACSVWALPMI